MAARMPDLRSLVPRVPPPGLREWTLERYQKELGRSGLIYEAAYVKDWGLAQMLDEWSKPKKIKMVRVTCSCCGENILLDWGRDAECGYGFIHPDDEEGDWAHTVTAAGDETTCPICGARVLVNKRAAVRDYYVSAECSVMSAGLAGKSNLLTLTGWTVQRRIYRSGHESLEFIPAEAYVFSPADCVQLMGWRYGYSGTAGYFIQYSAGWRQPKHWTERWGAAGAIFGLTPELVEKSCLPNCKLDVYMTEMPGADRYPVPYLRLYQMHPNVEHILVHGLPRVLRDLIAREARSQSRGKNAQGLIYLPELNWAETRPAQMLHLTKEELRLAREQDWGVLFWNLFVSAREHGERLTGEDIQNAFYLGDDAVAELVGRGPVAKSIRYLLKQCESLAVEDEDEDEDTAPRGIPDVRTLLDYWSMSRTLGRDLDDPAVRFPKNLLEAHDRAAELAEQRELDSLAQQFRQRRRLLRKYSFLSDGLFIRPAASQRELTEEGNALHHCVGTYGKSHAEGRTAIFFIRRVSKPRESFYTLELDEQNWKVRQNRGKHNCGRTPEVQAFEDKWLAWVQAGCRRDKDGRPVLPGKKGRGAA